MARTYAHKAGTSHLTYRHFMFRLGGGYYDWMLPPLCTLVPLRLSLSAERVCGGRKRWEAASDSHSDHAYSGNILLEGC